MRFIIKDSIAVAINRNSHRQQNIRSCCGQLVCVGEWWAASFFVVVVRVLDDGEFLLSLSRSVGCYGDFETGHWFCGAVKMRKLAFSRNHNVRTFGEARTISVSMDKS